MYGINIRLVRLALLLAGLALLLAPGAALAAPSVTVAPASGPPGTTFVINGTGFNAGETIRW